MFVDKIVDAVHFDWDCNTGYINEIIGNKYQNAYADLCLINLD